ncbi:MAG: hypothetical protein V2I51_11510, partial [Anderseniella sp.]|nr:hypothetical protein [Anderseniella sp.]
ASILRSLGFSAQRRKADPAKPVQEANPPGEPSAEAEPPAAEVPVEAPAQAEQPAEQATAAAPEGEAPAAAPEAAGQEPEFVDVWWPKDTGPFRHQKQAHRQHKATGKPAGKHGKGKPRHADGGKPRRSTGSQPAKPRKEREADPNSPFAILSQLKQDLSRK